MRPQEKNSKYLPMRLLGNWSEMTSGRGRYSFLFGLHKLNYSFTLLNQELQTLQ